MPAATTDATTLGQLVILAGLVITAMTQIALALINRRETAEKADALALKVETTAAELAIQHARQAHETEDLMRRGNEEVKTQAQKAYTAANDMNEKIASLTSALDQRFDKLVAGGNKVHEE